jgi:hemoglobin
MSQLLDASPFEMLGGESAVRALVDRFYDIMDSDPVTAGLRALHREDLSEPRERLYLFLCGWLGGPQYYVEKHGHPMLRARHMPFAIDERMRDEWLYAMFKAFDELHAGESLLKSHFEQAFWRTADFMRNV